MSTEHMTRAGTPTAASTAGRVWRLVPLLMAVMAALYILAGAPASAVAAPPTVTTEAAIAVQSKQATLKATVNPQGLATTYYFEYGTTKFYGTKLPASPESVGSGTSNIAVSQTITGLSQNATYHFRVVAQSEAGTAEGEDFTFTTTGFNFVFSEEGPGNGQLKRPNLGIATDAEGNIWVADTQNNRVEKFNSKGEYLTQCGKEGTGNGEFNGPKGLAIDPSGNVWVVDSGNNRVEKFNAKCEYLSQFGKEGSSEGQFKSPAGIAFSGTNFFVVDSGNNRVEKFSSTLKFLAQFGKEGSGDGEFKSPTGVVVTSRIWVTDTGNNRLQAFNSSTLNFAKKIGKEGSGEGEFKSPSGITSDFQGKLWVVDSGNNRAEKFDQEGEYLDGFGETGAGAGQLIEPTGITTPAAQQVLILDTGNSRVEGWTVSAEPPNVIARLASDLKVSSATLNATVNPEAVATSYWFEYGTTTAYGTKVPTTPESIGSGSANVQVSQTATGLSEGITYHFRAVAESAAGAVAGADRSFEIWLPIATTEAATGIESTKATLKGKVNPKSSTTNYWFEYGPTKSYGTKVPISPEAIGSGATNVAVSQIPTGLSPATLYHFRVVAESEVGTTNGEDFMFTTKP